MRPRTCIVIASAITFGAALFLGAAWAGEPIQVSGTMACKTTEQHSVPVESDPGHVLVVQIETCVGSASGESARFDGGQQTWFELDDLVRGSGMIHGYELAKYKDGSTGTTSYAGAQVATMIDGKPQWTALGTLSRCAAPAAWRMFR
jgi:glycerate-2-kinase